MLLPYRNIELLNGEDVFRREGDDLGVELVDGVLSRGGSGCDREVDRLRKAGPTGARERSNMTGKRAYETNQRLTRFYYMFFTESKLLVQLLMYKQNAGGAVRRWSFLAFFAKA